MILANHLRQTLLEPLKERQRMEGFEEGYAKGFREGFVEGFKEGLEIARVEREERADAIWRAWNARREKAEADGAPFDEPPPNLGG